MRRYYTNMVNKVASTDGRLIRLVLVILTTILFILGAGAPEASGGVGISWGGGFGG